MIKLYLLRHTKVDVVPGTCYGQTDVELAPSFDEEKIEVLQKLAGLEYNAIVSSPLKRCAKLAAAIDPEGSITSFDKRLKELDFGDWENKAWNEIIKTPEAKQWFGDYLHVACPGGESYQDMIDRLQCFLKGQSPQGNLLVITHGGVIRAFYALLNNLSPKKAFDLQVDYGQVIELQIET